MNKTLFSYIFLFLFIGIHVYAQCDYTQSRYQTTATFQVQYGKAERFNGTSAPLYLNIFKPKGDNNSSRPLFIWVHGGGFYGGDYNDFNNLCQFMASKGIVAATISYRLGFVPPSGFDYPFTFDQNEIIRAVYRGMQDTKGAIRFLKNRHLEDSTDLNNVFVGGSSAGGFIALAACYLDSESEKPIDTWKLGSIKRGNTEYSRPDLGPIDGTLNKGQADASVKGVVSIAGGLSNPGIIDNNQDILAFLYHQTMDPVVNCGYDQPYWDFPAIPDNYPFIYGSCEILNYYDSLGVNPDYYDSIIYPGNEHSIHDIVLFAEKLTSFLNKAICETPTATISVPTEKESIYPNPATDYILVPRMKNISIVGLDGKRYYAKYTQVDDRSRLDITDLPMGIYFISAELNTGQPVQWKFVKN